VNKAGRLVWPTLTPAAALDFSARLLGPVFQTLLGDILTKKDIGVQECNEMVQLLRWVAMSRPKGGRTVVRTYQLHKL
jgi:hypothetical protein